jgi:CelD/BcsL family acetyltransferase involved in cellulose biosynthesis
MTNQTDLWPDWNPPTSRRRASKARSLAGPNVLQELGSALDDLHAATEAPITARRVWLQNWIGCHPDYEPWALAIESDQGRLEAAALLALRHGSRVLEIVALGHGPSDQARLPARDEAAAKALARLVAGRLRRLPGPWRLNLEQLPVDDAVAREIVRLSRSAATVPGDSSPRIRIGVDRTINRYVGRNTRGLVSNKSNRLRRAGFVPSFAQLTEHDEIVRVLPEMEWVRRQRDGMLLRISDLDDEHKACFWRSVVLAFALRDEAEVTTLRIDGELAAYCICFVDGSAYRYWDGRFAPKWSQFSPGALVLHAAVCRTIADESFDEFDWMRGEERFKAGASNDVVPAQHLLAWSSPAVRRLTEAPNQLRSTLARLKDRHPPLQRAWKLVKAYRIRRRTRPRGN